MSSGRFPGKVLAPFRGRPLLAHVVERVAQGVPRERLVVATSVDPADDPLEAYGKALGVDVFREIGRHQQVAPIGGSQIDRSAKSIEAAVTQFQCGEAHALQRFGCAAPGPIK